MPVRVCAAHHACLLCVRVARGAQEPTACPASVSAIAHAVNRHRDVFDAGSFVCVCVCVACVQTRA